MDKGEDENPPEASLAISNVLDDAGYLTPARILHRSVQSLITLLFDIVCITTGMQSFGHDARLIGSAGEGLLHFAMFNGTSCDGDIMHILSKCEAYEHSHVSASQQHWQFEMEPCEKNPGYVKLRVIREGSVFTLPMSTSISSFFEYDADSNVHYLSNAIPASINNFGGSINMMNQYTQCLQIADALTEQVVTGPSISRVTSREFRPGTFVVNKVDNVISIPCPTWPSVAKDWITRQRVYDWPTSDFISEHVQRGCYVVPTGCKECARTYLDWRLSFVLVEQALIWNFNVTQVKCLLLLKQLKSFLFQEQIGDIISSYILKTTVFWMIEESSPDLWVPHRLLTTVQMCLDRLISFVQNDFCPNFFIRSCNLLGKRYTATEKQTVLQICRRARQNTRELLCQTPPFNDAFRSQYMEDVALRTVNLDMFEGASQKMHSFCMCMINNYISMIIRFPLSCQQTLSTTIRYCQTTSCQLRTTFSKNNIPLKEAAYLMTQVGLMQKRFVWTNSYLSAENNKSRYHCMRMLQYGFKGTNDLVENVTICHLNTVVGNYYITNEKLRQLITKLKRLPYVRIQVPVGSVFTGGNPTGILHILSEMLGHFFDESDSQIPNLTDILFLRFEIDILPPPIQMEMYPNQTQGEHFDLSSGMESTVAVDPLVYACFLRFWCCVKLDQNIEKLKARDDMVWCCSLPGITNKAVAFNLLGYCHNHLEEYTDAFNAFCTAWKQIPRSDATLVHLFALVYSTIRRELNETCPD